MVPTFATLHRLTILMLCLLTAACTTESNLPITPISTQAATTETHQTVRVEVPVTVEVTRVYTQPVIIEATPTPPRACAHHRFQATGEITIGSLLPLSGPGAYTAGFAMQTALNLALEQVEREAQQMQAANGSPAITWRLVTYDTAGRAERAAEFAHRLITLDCAAVIIGGYHSSVAFATAALTEEYQIPYIVLHAAADDLTTQYRSVFRIAPTFSMYAQMPVALLQTLSKTQARTQAAIDDAHRFDDVLFIVDPSTISNTLSKTILDHFDRTDINSEIMAVDLPAQDFSSTVARILSRPSLPDVVFIYINSEAALALHVQLLNAGIGPEHGVTIVNSQAARHSDAFWHAVPNGTDTLITHFGPWPGDMSPVGHEFVAAYSPYSEQWPPAFVFAAYDAVLLFADATARAETLEGPVLTEALGQSNISLAAGHYRFGDSLPGSDSLAGPAPPASFVMDISDPHQWIHVPMYYLRYTHPEQPFHAMHVEWSAAQNHPFRFQPQD